jgi:magnesium-protoporphyrin O-methyltransferase
VRLHSGDMLTRIFGRFDAVVSMDSIIHYTPKQAIEALMTMAGNTEKKIVFTHVPRTPLLQTMYLAGKLFPRRDRSPVIEPVASDWLEEALTDQIGSDGWSFGKSVRVSSGFYNSQAMEISR